MTSYKFRTNDPDRISLNAATSGVGKAIAFNDCRQVDWEIEGQGVITAGKVAIGSAHVPDYAGKWNELDLVDVSVLSGGGIIGGSSPMPPGGFVRGEIPITDPITGGGTITVRFNGLQN